MYLLVVVLLAACSMDFAEAPARVRRAMHILPSSPSIPAPLNLANTGAGVSLFGAVAMLAAHVGGRLRVLFDWVPFHLGPAILGSGLGAGVGGAFR